MKMASFDYDIGVIGGGAAGLTVASGAAQLGAKTLLIEQEELLGGDCLHYGCVPSKTLISSASLYHRMQHSVEYGLPAAELGKVDFSRVSERIRSVIAHIQHHDSVERFSGLGVDVRFGRPEFTDEHIILLDGKALSSRKWVIATGSSPAVPAVPGLDKIPYLTNREIFYLDELPEHLIVLGAGAIAIEMAQAFNRLGSRVTVIQRGEQILSKEDRDLADDVMAHLQQEWVEFRLGSSLLAVGENSAGKQVEIRTQDGEIETISGTHILVALGRSVNTAGLGLENAGVVYDDRGIEVDNRLRTSQKHIFAAGDVNGGYQFTHAAGYEGGIVVSNGVFNLPRKVNYTWMPWCTYSSPELASVGLNEKRAEAAGVSYRVYEESFSDNDRAQAEGETAGRIKLLLDRKEKPLGVQILGSGAGELLAEWVATLNGGVKLSTLAGAVHPYPTRAEINKRVVGSLFSEKIFSDRVRSILKLLFKYQGG
jgi:pyruvate/2-oxoglutarate dehydrogenase complex dihydrolipoamide dehydrogenase (E3) component